MPVIDISTLKKLQPERQMKQAQIQYNQKKVSAQKALSHIQPGQRVFIDGNAAFPEALVNALVERDNSLSDIELNHLLTFGEDAFAGHSAFRHNAWFIGPSIRKAVNEKQAGYIPIFLGEIARLIRSGSMPIDVALIHVSEPDRYGFMSYGIEVSVTKPAAEAAKLVIAQVNPDMPRTLGDSFIHISEVDFVVEARQDIIEVKLSQISDTEKKIGENVAQLIEDGSTLQLGIGGIPNAVLAALGDKKNLGIHTEMFSDGILPLLESGVINNQAKGFHRGKVIAGFAMGSRELYDYIDNNPLFEFRPSHYTNDPVIVAQNKKMVAINSAIEIDLTGQVCADSMAHDIYSGIGGQVDFIRGAARSEGGKPVIALPSTAAGGKVSRIVTELKPGAGVVTSRGDVHYVVTEYGAVNLFGLNLNERARALIEIAHPDFREQLAQNARWV